MNAVMLNVAKMSAPAIRKGEDTFVSQVAVQNWLRASAAKSDPIAKDICNALADAIDGWTEL